MYFFISHTLVQEPHPNKKGAGAEAGPTAGMCLPGIRLSARPWLLWKALSESFTIIRTGPLAQLFQNFQNSFLLFI